MEKEIKDALVAQDYALAQTLLEQKDDVESKTLLARIYNMQSEYQKAYTLLKDLVLDDDGYIQFMVSANGVLQYEDSIATFAKVVNQDQFDVLLSSVVAHLGLQNYEAALALLKRAELLDMKADVLAYYYYFAYTQLKKYDIAQNYAKVAFELNPTSFNLHNYMSASMHMQDYESALQSYQEGLETQEVAWLYFVALLQGEHYYEAIKVGERLKTVYPQLYYVEDGLAQAYYMVEDWQNTIQNAQKYENVEDVDLKARNLNFIRMSYDKLGEYAKADLYIQKLSELENEDISLYAKAERLFEEQKYEEILTLLKDVDTPVALRQKAVVYYQLENYQEVVKLANILLSLYPDVELRKIAVLSFIYTGDSASAVSELKRMEQEKVALDFVYSQLMNIYMVENNEEAIHYAFLGTEYENDKFEPQARLAQVYANFNKNEDAIKALEKALLLGEEAYQKEWVHKNLGILYFKTMQLEKAWQQFSQIKLLNKDEQWLAYHAGIVAMELGKYEEAINCFQFLHEQEEYGDDIVYRLALCYIFTKQNNKFQAIYDECEQLAEKSEENNELFTVVRERAFRPEV